MSALTLVADTTSRAARSRNEPVQMVGAVSVLEPTGGSPYYRLRWTWPDGTAGSTSGGRALDGAVAKAEQIDAQCGRAAGGKAMTPLPEIIEDYLSSGKGRNQKTGGDWSAGQLQQMRAKLQRCLRGHRKNRGLDVDRALLDLMRSQAGTRRTRKENVIALRGLLRWGASAGYFTADQAQLLPNNVYDLQGEIAATAAPKRRTRTRAVGESEEYITSEDAPSIEQIVALGEALQKVLCSGRLAVELAADAGPRWGELFQLTAGDVVVTPGRVTKKGKAKPATVHLRIDWQVDPAGTAETGRRKRPKGDKTRRSGVGEVSVTGYRLHEALLARREQALAEQAEGTNEQALLFPTETGKMFFYTAFSNDYFKPAAIAAGWPYVEWVYEGYRWNEQTERWVKIREDRVQFDLTWHSLRHRYARTCVDIRELTPGQLMAHGGWENETVVKNRYYNAGSEHFDSGLGKF